MLKDDEMSLEKQPKQRSKTNRKSEIELLNKRSDKWNKKKHRNIHVLHKNITFGGKNMTWYTYGPEGEMKKKKS